MPYTDRFSETAGSNGNAPAPIVHVDSRTRLYSDLRRKLYPSEIRGILQNALMGDLYWQDQLFAIVFDGWPRAQKNLRELTSAVSRIDYVVTPYKERGARAPSKIAIEKADTVRRGLWG